MKLPQPTINNFFKFEAIGDSVAGDFVDFKTDIDGTFGKESHLVLKVDGANVTINCKTYLARSIAQNLAAVTGKRLTVTYTRDEPTDKGNPMKVFDVDVEPIKKAAPAKAADFFGKDDEEIPF